MGDPSEIVVLKRRTLVTPTKFKRAEKFVLTFAILSPILFVFAIVWIFYQHGDYSSPYAAWVAFWKNTGEISFLDWVQFVILIVAARWFYLAKKYEQLTLSPTELKYQSPLPTFLQFMLPSWTIKWDQINSVRLQIGKLGGNSTTAQLILYTDSVQQKLIPYMWIDPNNFSPTTSIWAQFKLQWGENNINENIFSNVEKTILMMYIKEVLPELVIARKNEVGPFQFSLENNRASITVVSIFMFAFVYAIFDTFTASETYVERPFYEFYINTGIVSTMLLGIILKKNNVPTIESIGLAIMAGIAIGCSMYPALLRINAWTDTNGLQSYEYIRREGLTFEPIRIELPTIHLDQHNEYWEEIENGSLHTFELRKGGLDFYQLNLEPIYDSYRQYHENKIDKNVGPTKKENAKPTSG